jgi:hypothetical protein
MGVRFEVSWRREGKGKGRGWERKGKEGKRREGKGREGKGKEGKGKERKGKERKRKGAVFYVAKNKTESYRTRQVRCKIMHN